MLQLRKRGDKYYYPLLLHPVSRVMKFEKFFEYFSGLPAGGTVVDYGSGDRPYEDMLLGKFDRYIAADYEAANAAHARRPDVLIEGNRLDLPDASVKAVVLTEVMEHLYEPKVVLSEINRILEPGGILIGTVPFAINEHEQPFDFHRYTFFCLQAMFDEAGFEVQQIEYVGDNVGVAILSMTRVAGVVPKALHKLRMAPLAVAIHAVVRIPELIYYWLVKVGLDPNKSAYYRSYPFGFAFMVTKN